jgi:PAS domain-containing protein
VQADSSNHEYIAIAQDKHPYVLGQPYRLTWPELWAENLGIKQRLLKGLSTGESTRKDNDPLFLCRSNIANEECYIDWCLVPFPREPGQPGSEIGEEGIVRGTVDFRIAEKGRVGGLVNPVFENTNRVLMDRRLRLLRELGARVSVARVTNEFWGIVMRELREAELDVPGVVAYGVSNEGDGILRVVGHIGLDGGHDFFPETLDLNSLSDIGVQSYVKQILDGDPVIIEGESVLSSFEPRGWGDPLTKAILVPIKPSTTRPPQGVLFFVLSPRRPYDEDYALFIELLTRQIATSLTNVQLFEEEIRRGREIAEADRRKGEELERALAQRTRELRASQGFMGRLAEICPVGIFVSDPQGNITFVNDSWVPSPLWRVLICVV